MDLIIPLFFGIYSFLITSLDDFLVLVALYTLYPKNFQSVIIGTSFGLIVVILAAFVSISLLNTFLDIHKYSDYLICGAMLWVAYWILQSIEQNDESEKKYFIGTSFLIAFKSATIYVQNGSDDFVTYIGFLSSYKDIFALFFICGIFLGLVILTRLASLTTVWILAQKQSFQIRLKYCAALCAVVIGLSYVIL